MDERGSGPRGLDAMMAFAEEMLIAGMVEIERELGPEETRRMLKLAGRVLAV